MVKFRCPECGKTFEISYDKAREFSVYCKDQIQSEILGNYHHYKHEMKIPHILPEKLKVGNDNSVDSEQFQGCYHELPEYMTGGSTEKTDCVVGMPKRGDGKMYCNNCYALDNFKTLSGFQDYYSNKFLVYVCNCCGNVQMRVKDVEQIINVPTE